MGGLCEGNAAAAAEKELRRGREREREKEKERKVKIMCSYGGSMVARPSDGALRYVGGDTRLCTVRHDVSLAQLLAKAAQLHMCGGGGVAGAGTALKLKLKYQAPAQRLDSLVSLTCDGDVRAMMRLYDRFLGSTAPAAAAAVPQPQPQLQLLRLFLFQEAAAVAVAAAVPVVAHHPAASSNFQLQRPHDDFYAYPPQLHMNSHLHYHHHHHQQQQQQQQQQGMHLMDHSAAAFLAPSSAPLYFQGYSHAHGEFYQEPLVFQQQHLVKDPAPPPVHGTPVPANRAYHEVSRLNSDVAQGSVPFHVVATEGSELGIPAPASAPAYSHSLMELWSFSSEGFISPGVGLVEPFSAYPPSHTFEHQFVACTYAQQQQADVQGTEAVFETARSQGIAFGPQGAALLLERQSKGMAVDDSKLHDSNHPLSSKTRTDDFPLAYGSSSSDISSAAFAARDPQPFICLESEHDSGKSDRFIEEYGRHFAADISDKLRTQLDMRDLSHVGRFLDSASPVQLNRQVSENSALEFGLSEIDFLNSEVESTEFPLKKSTDVPECAESLLPTDDLLQCEESSHRDLKFPATPVPNNNLKEGISVKDNVKNTVIMGAAVQQLNDPLMRICTQRNRFENNLFHIPQDLMSVKVTEDEDSIFEEPTTEELETDSSTNKNEEDFPSDLQKIRNADLEDLREIGSGTFGTVYYGKWRGSDVAIKRINNSCFIGKPAEQKQMRADFLKEARTLAQLHHPNVVAFYGIVPDGPGGTFATVTEFMVNGSLRKVLQLQKEKSRTLDHRRRLIIALDAAFGMEYLHGKNIVHFDLKCENLLVNIRDPHRPICKVGDLGLSKIKHQTLVSAGLQGTLPWMAPELLNGRSRVSEKVDVFSFGIVMWELLTCEEPYANMHAGAILGGIVNNTLRPPIPKGCDPLWRMLMERCWSDDPSRRPNFTEIIDELRAMVALLPSKAQNQQALKQN